MRAAGIPDEDIKRWGCWTSNAYKLYVHVVMTVCKDGVLEWQLQGQCTSSIKLIVQASLSERERWSKKAQAGTTQVDG